MASRKGKRKITTLEGLAAFVVEELGEVQKKLDFLKGQNDKLYSEMEQVRNDVFDIKDKMTTVSLRMI